MQALISHQGAFMQYRLNSQPVNEDLVQRLREKGGL